MVTIRPISRRRHHALLTRLILLARRLDLHVNRNIERLLRRINESSLTQFLSCLVDLNCTDTGRGRLTPRIMTLTPSSRLFCFKFPFTTIYRMRRTDLRRNCCITARKRVLRRPILQRAQGINILFLRLFYRNKDLITVCSTQYLTRVLCMQFRHLSRNVIMFTVCERVNASFPLQSNARISTTSESINGRLQRVSLPRLSNNQYVPIRPSNSTLNSAQYTRTNLTM